MAIADMEPETQQESEALERLQTLERHVILISPSMGVWQGRYQLKDAEVTVDGQVADKNTVTVPQIKLMELSDRGKHYRDVFQKINSSRSRIVEKYSVPFPIRGVRIVPRVKATSFFRELVGEVDNQGRAQYSPEAKEQSILYRLQQAVDAFLQEYPSIVRQAQLQTKPEVWQRIAGKIPDSRSIRNKFYLTTTAIRLAGQSSELIDEEELAGMESYVRESLHQQLEEAIESMVAEPRQQLVSAINKLEELIARGGQVSTSSFNPLRQAVEKIRMFEFMSTPALAQRLRELESAIGGVNASKLDEITYVSTGLSNVLGTVRDAVADASDQADVIRDFGRPARALDLG